MAFVRDYYCEMLLILCYSLISLILNDSRHTYAYIVMVLQQDCINSSSLCCNHNQIVPLPMLRKCEHCNCVGIDTLYNHRISLKKNIWWNKQQPDPHYYDQSNQIVVAYDLLNRSKLFIESDSSFVKETSFVDAEEKNAPLKVLDALELLRPDVDEWNVREYAVSNLEYAADDDLSSYMLQLVQALKYENVEQIITACKMSVNDPSTCEMDAVDDMNVIHSYMHEVPTYRTGTVHKLFQAKTLTSFLIRRASTNRVLATYLYWYLSIECENPAYNGGYYENLYRIALQTYVAALRSDNLQTLNILSQQRNYFTALRELMSIVLANDESKTVNVRYLRYLLSKPMIFDANFTDFEPMPFPLEPHIRIKGMTAEKATFFTSALMPCKLHFVTHDGAEYAAVFKHGTDLRQDQLILQMISLIDKTFKANDLDLKLTPYKVIALSTEHGLVEFIESLTITRILQVHGSILNFLRNCSSETGPYGLDVAILDNFIRSCAGYSVITYVLGIGDRHFDNLLLTTSGRLFHVDFGYFLGSSPTVIQYPMKLSEEMIEAMGGIESQHFNQFRMFCREAYLVLRRNAGAFSNVLSLMPDSGIKDVAVYERDAIRVVNDYMRLDLDDDEASVHIDSVVNKSVDAVLPNVYEQLHRVAQFFREI